VALPFPVHEADESSLAFLAGAAGDRAEDESPDRVRVVQGGLQGGCAAAGGAHEVDRALEAGAEGFGVLWWCNGGGGGEVPRLGEGLTLGDND
jgi:hypothetical protein